MKLNNFMLNLPKRLDDELVENLFSGSAFRAERIISMGHASPAGFWYDQPHDEWVMVLKGRAGLRFEVGEQIMEMGPGDHLTIPAHCRHRVEWTDSATETIWLAIHYEA